MTWKIGKYFLNRCNFLESPLYSHGVERRPEQGRITLPRNESRKPLTHPAYGCQAIVVSTESCFLEKRSKCNDKTVLGGIHQNVGTAQIRRSGQGRGANQL
ncbi:hypothetical protein D9M71_724810 [compost metagenome]